jgi:hypothetical protein
MIRYLELPPVPQAILNNIPNDYTLYESKFAGSSSFYIWTDTFNLELNHWGQQHISKDLYFGFQIINGNLPAHRDTGTLTKLSYIIETGGKDVETVFHNDNGSEAYSFIIEPHRWHILEANRLHSVRGINSGQTRFSITARIFP